MPKAALLSLLLSPFPLPPGPLQMSPGRDIESKVPPGVMKFLYYFEEEHLPPIPKGCVDSKNQRSFISTAHHFHFVPLHRVARAQERVRHYI